MKFSSRPKSRAGARRQIVSPAPAEVDTLESRLLLTTPDVLAPVGDVTDATPQFKWEAVDNAMSYDLWVTSLETYQTVLVEKGIIGTDYTPADGALSQGRIRIWARANLTGGGTSNWSPASEASIQAAPTITGPSGAGARNLVGDSSPEITWTASSAARRFQIWVTDLSEKIRLEEAAAAAGTTTPIAASSYATLYTVENFQRLKDQNGNDVPDVFGNPVNDEVRKFVLPNDATQTGSKNITVDPSSAVDIGTDRITWTGHGLPAGTKIHYDAGGGTAIGGLTDDTGYYIISVDPNTIQLAATAADALAQTAIDLTDSGMGTRHRFSVVNAPRVLNTGRYQIWMRTVDLRGRVSGWSASRTFDIGPAPQNLSPASSSFQKSPELRWDNVARATHYEIFVGKDGGPSPFFRRTIPATSNPLQHVGYIIQSTTGAPIVDDSDGVVEAGETARLDENGNEVRYNIEPGDYAWWVRAVNKGGDGSRIPTVYGAWSDATKFSTIKGPTVTAPVPASGAVTAGKPTITWTPIHGAARYQVLVYRLNVQPPFLNVQTPQISYTLTEDIPAGQYTVWVRGIDTRGNFSPWSAPYTFTATGGAPVVTATVSTADPAFWAFTWAAVPEAVGYEYWISQDGVDFDFRRETFSLLAPSQIVRILAGPLNSGAHRIWVRAIRADNSMGPWSQAVSFTVAAADETAEDAREHLLANVRVSLSPDEQAPPETVDVPSHQPTVPPADERDEPASQDVTEEAELPPDSLPIPDQAPLPADLLSALAQECVDAEWWDQTPESA